MPGTCLLCSRRTRRRCKGCPTAYYCDIWHQYVDWPAHKTSCPYYPMSKILGFCGFCKQPAMLRCSACQLQPYCGREHQKKDWAEHKKSCCVYTIKTNSDGDSYLVAAEDIKKGQKIINEVPLVIGPNYLNHEDHVCVGCHVKRNDVVQRCPSCDWPACNSKCPGLKDVTRHGMECAILSKIKSSTIHQTHAILPLRCLVMQKTDPEKWKVYQKMADRAMKLSLTKISNEVMYFLRETILKPLARVDPGILPDCSENTLRRVLSVLEVYGVKVHAPQYVLMFAVCQATSLIEHSCVPNTRLQVNLPPLPLPHDIHHTERPLLCKVVMRATQDIAKGENISMVFMDTWMCTWARQHSLASRRQITCRCRRCMDPTELGTHFGTLRCTTNSCSGWVLMADPPHFDTCFWKCQKCGKIYNYLHVMRTLTSLKDEMESCQLGAVQSTEKYEKMLKRLEKFLHPNHHFCILIKERLSGMYAKPLLKMDGKTMSNHQLERAEGLCREVLNIMTHPDVEERFRKTQECLTILSLVTMETAQRKKASGEWDSARFNKALSESQELIAKAMKLGHELLDDQSAKERLPLGLMQKLAVDEIMQQMKI